MARPAIISQKIVELLEKEHALSASQLVDTLGNIGSQVNKTSVYRALERLSNDGILCKQTLSGESLVYELRDHHHDHLVCEVCGKVQKIPCLTKSPKKIDEFEVYHHHMTLFGVCKNCRTSI